MKKFKLPLIEIDIDLYLGEKEFNTYIKRTIAEGAVGEPPSIDDHDGACYGSYVWIKGFDRNCLFHELEHCMFAIFQSLRAEEEEEFRAYLYGYVFDTVLTWVEKEEKKENEKSKDN